MLKANGFFQSLGIVAVSLFIPAQAYACMNLSAGGFVPLQDTFWSCVYFLSLLLGSLLAYRYLKTYFHKKAIKVSPLVAWFSAIVFIVILGVSTFLFWPGNRVERGCPVGARETMHCGCVDAEGKAVDWGRKGPLTVEPKKRLRSLESMINQKIEQQSGYRDPSLLKPFER